MKSRFSPLFFLVLLLPLLVAAAALKQPLLGGWNPIKNVKDPQVQELGKFAVAEYNKQSEESLKFKGVVSGESQVVAGMNYRLILKAKNGGLTAKYQAVVFERPWENLKKLTSFEPFAN